MGQQDEQRRVRQELLKELTDLQMKWADHRAQIAALSPEERATFDRLWEENQRNDEFDEILNQVRTGAMSPEEAGLWLNKRVAPKGE